MSQFTISQMLGATGWLALACSVLALLPRTLHPPESRIAIAIVLSGWVVGTCLSAALGTLKGEPWNRILISCGTLPIMLGVAGLIYLSSR